MERTLDQINQRIAKGQVRVWTALEAKAKLATLGIQEAFEQVDVITTGTFEPMESSGAIVNLGHTDPPIKIRQAWLNGVPAYAGFGAVDLYLGAAQPSEQADQAYGGGHVIADLVAGKRVHLRAIGQVTDCYPPRRLRDHPDPGSAQPVLPVQPPAMPTKTSSSG
jgi:uncharacterized protein (DUF39 family)